MKNAIIFGVTGQDGSYLSELLLAKGYRVVGVSRRASIPNTSRIQHLLGRENFLLVPGDATDALCVRNIIDRFSGLDCVDGCEVYNLAAQSHVGSSFDEPSHTFDVTFGSALHCLEAIRQLRPEQRFKTRFYQASSSEMFGSACSWFVDAQPGYFELRHSPIGLSGRRQDSLSAFQCESTPMLPNSPYAVAKLAAHNLVGVYRDSYNLHASSGILFNHESPRRGEDFVTRKITRYLGQLGRFLTRDGEDPGPLRLGNLQARRDWGYARDYVRAMWLMVQQDEPDDYVIATGETHSVRQFLDTAWTVFTAESQLGEVTPKEIPLVIDVGLRRPCEVPYLRGDASKARRELGWQPVIGFQDLVREMLCNDLGRKDLSVLSTTE